MWFVVLFFVFESCEVMILRRGGAGVESPTSNTGQIIPRKASRGPVVLGDQGTRHGGALGRAESIVRVWVRGGPESCQFSASAGRCMCVR